MHPSFLGVRSAPPEVPLYCISWVQEVLVGMEPLETRLPHGHGASRQLGRRSVKYFVGLSEWRRFTGTIPAAWPAVVCADLNTKAGVAAGTAKRCLFSHFFSPSARRSLDFNKTRTTWMNPASWSKRCWLVQAPAKTTANQLKDNSRATAEQSRRSRFRWWV